jgi:alpha-D-xyloside xylohydrolase
MKPTRALTVLCALFLFWTACSVNGYEKTGDGILIRLKAEGPGDVRLMKIQVCADGIVRVVASPADTLSSRPSLMAVKTDRPASAWTVTEGRESLILSTAKMKVEVSTKTGEIRFMDADGRPLLKEKSGGGKTLLAADVMGERTWHVRQVFDSPVDEAFYGLGAHQNGIMNYKGHDVDLWQYNIVDVVPFLVSSRRYGILWDNNSRTRFGDFRDDQPLSSFELFGTDGAAGGLTAEYFSAADFMSPLSSRRETGIDYAFLDVRNAWPDGFNPGRGSVRWSGFIGSRESGEHRFRLYACGYVRMWLDGRLVVDSWRQNWLPWTHILPLDMRAGKRHAVRIEWIPDGGFIGLTVLTPPKEDFGKILSLWSEVGDQIDYYFIYGGDMDGVIRGYRDVTGRSPMMPKWALGMWQCRERYRTQDELLSVVREFRKRRIPLDNIVQDWFYWPEDKWGDHDFDAARYPDPGGMVETLHDSLHARIMISVWPKFYVGTENYKAMSDSGWLYARNVEKGQKDWVGPGYVSTFYDPYGPGARRLFWSGIDRKLFRLGFDAWWLDSTEPDIQSNLSFDEMRLRMNPTALGTAARYLNTFSLMNARAVYEGQRLSDPDRRVFILTRSAFAGQQRYAAATWSGDVASRWEDLGNQIPAGLNFSLSGIPYWTTDIGGFSVERRFENAKGRDLDEWRELMTRWFQFGTFCPLFRVHGQFPYREMFNVAPEDHPAYRTMLAYDRLRYRLMPYLYSLAGKVTRDGYTVMRALVMDFGADRNVLNVGNQYMFGPALLVNPVTEYGARSRNVYLPAGTGWYDLKTGSFIEGGRSLTADAPYTDIPVYVREGSIVPFGPEIQYSDEKPADPVWIYVYAGRDASFELYEDENTNTNYEKGAFSIIPLSYREADGTLTLQARKGGFPGMLQKRTFRIRRVAKNRGAGLDFDAKPDVTVAYDGTAQTIRLR